MTSKREDELIEFGAELFNKTRHCSSSRHAGRIIADALLERFCIVEHDWIKGFGDDEYCRRDCQFTFRGGRAREEGKA